MVPDLYAGGFTYSISCMCLYDAAKESMFSLFFSGYIVIDEALNKLILHHTVLTIQLAVLQGIVLAWLEAKAPSL